MTAEEIVIMSGKGGAGKTSVLAAFTRLLYGKTVFVDADVDASNLHLLMDPRGTVEHTFDGPKEPVVDGVLCVKCGLCRHLCRFDAVNEDMSINYTRCEGCGVCYNNCPHNAIFMKDTTAGVWYRSNTVYGPMIHARLNPGGENSGKLVARIRKEAKKLADEEESDLILIDGPPGVGCAAISAITGVNLLVMVIESSLSGMHDAERMLKLARHFGIPCAGIINKHDVNPDITKKIESLMDEMGVKIIGKIPYNEFFYTALSECRAVTDYPDNDLYELIRILWYRIQSIIKKEEKQ